MGGLTSKILSLIFLSMAVFFFRALLIMPNNHSFGNWAGFFMLLIMGAFMGLFGLMGFFPKLGDTIERFEINLRKKKCSMCSKWAFEDLYGDKHLGKYCREHLIVKYTSCFLNSHLKSVIVEFQANGSSATGTVYGYYPFSELRKYGFGKEEETIKKLISSIEGKNCNSCSKTADVLFVSKESGPWNKYGSKASLDFLKSGIYLCREHALKRSLPALQKNPKQFTEGLYIPYRESGIAITTEI